MIYRTALVTGATAEIGAAFVAELAARNCDLVIVARRSEMLSELAEEMSARHGSKVEVLAADLTKNDQLDLVERRLSDPERPVDLLVNNAGALTNGPFARLPLDEEVRQLQLNVTAVVRLTHRALGPMVLRGRGGIINVSSIAGEAPAPFSATYAGGYAFVTTFSQSVHLEVAEHGVHVTALLPGFTAAGVAGRGVRHPAPVVREALSAVAAGRPLCIPGARNKAAAVFSRLAPRSVVRAVMQGAATAGATVSAGSAKEPA